MYLHSHHFEKDQSHFHSKCCLKSLNRLSHLLLKHFFYHHIFSYWYYFSPFRSNLLDESETLEDLASIFDLVAEQIQLEMSYDTFQLPRAPRMKSLVPHFQGRLYSQSDFIQKSHFGDQIERDFRSLLKNSKFIHRFMDSES